MSVPEPTFAFGTDIGESTAEASSHVWEGKGMRLRVEEIRPGHRVWGREVLSVRSNPDSGTVRITVTDPAGSPGPGSSGSPVASLTFCYLAGEVIDEEMGRD